MRFRACPRQKPVSNAAGRRLGMFKKFLLLAITFFLLAVFPGCGEKPALKPVKIILPGNLAPANNLYGAKTEFTGLQDAIIVEFDKNISPSGRTEVLFGSCGEWVKLEGKSVKNRLTVKLPGSITQGPLSVLIVPQNFLNGLKKDIYIQISPRGGFRLPDSGVVPVLEKRGISKKMGLFCDSSALGLSKKIFLNTRKPFVIGSGIELRNGDDFEIESSNGGKYNIRLIYASNGKEKQIHAEISKKYVRPLPPPLNKKSAYFTYPEKAEGNIIEEIFPRKEAAKIKYVPYLPHIRIKSFPGEWSDFTVYSASVFPLTSQDIGVLELADFESGLRITARLPNFRKMMNFNEEELAAILRYEHFLMKEKDSMIENFTFPESLASIKTSVKNLSDKDTELSVIFLSRIKELKHGKITAQQLNSLVLDLANAVGKTPEERQKIKSLFHYPLRGNISETDANNVLNTNSDAWLYLLNAGNAEINGAVEKEVKKILNR